MRWEVEDQPRENLVAGEDFLADGNDPAFLALVLTGDDDVRHGDEVIAAYHRGGKLRPDDVYLVFEDAQHRARTRSAATKLLGPATGKFVESRVGPHILDPLSDYRGETLRHGSREYI